MNDSDVGRVRVRSFGVSCEALGSLLWLTVILGEVCLELGSWVWLQNAISKHIDAQGSKFASSNRVEMLYVRTLNLMEGERSKLHLENFLAFLTAYSWVSPLERQLRVPSLQFYIHRSCANLIEYFKSPYDATPKKKILSVSLAMNALSEHWLLRA